MMETLEDYKKMFEKMDRSEFFEINQPFIQNMIDTQKQIIELSKKPLIAYHPTNSNIQKQTESGKLYVRLLDVFKNQTLALNKILGNSMDRSDESDMFQAFKDKYNEK